MTKNFSLPKQTKPKRPKYLSPQPTHWIENKTPEGGEPPTGVLLLIKSWREGDEIPTIDTGYYSAKLKAFLTFDGIAIEEHSIVVAFHIIHEEDGEPFLILM